MPALALKHLVDNNLRERLRVQRIKQRLGIVGITLKEGGADVALRDKRRSDFRGVVPVLELEAETLMEGKCCSFGGIVVDHLWSLDVCADTGDRHDVSVHVRRKHGLEHNALG